MFAYNITLLLRLPINDNNLLNLGRRYRWVVSAVHGNRSVEEAEETSQASVHQRRSQPRIQVGFNSPLKKQHNLAGASCSWEMLRAGQLCLRKQGSMSWQTSPTRFTIWDKRISQRRKFVTMVRVPLLVRLLSCFCHLHLYLLLIVLGHPLD